MTAEIGKDEAVSGEESLRCRQPQLVMGWKRMQQKHGRTLAHDFVGKFRVTAGDLVHKSYQLSAISFQQNIDKSRPILSKCLERVNSQRLYRTPDTTPRIV